MAVTQVGTAPATVYTTTNGANTPALAWGTGQNRTAGNILVLTVTAAAVTSVTAPATPSGWNDGLASGNAATPHAYTAIYWKVATGGDGVPSITVTTSGTTRCGFSLFELTGAENVSSPVDTSGTYASGSTAASYTGITVTGSTNVAYAGEYGIAAFAFEYATASTASAFTAGSGWTNFSNDSSSSSRDHNAVDYATSAPSVGSAASDAASATSNGTGFAAAVLATFAPPHDPGPVLVPPSQPPGVRVSLQMAGQALASAIPQVAVTPPTPAPLYPLTQPVDGSRCLARPPRGIVRGIAGAALAVSVLGPPAAPLHQPVHPPVRVLPPAGRVIHRAGTFSGTGPPVVIKRRPVTPPVRPLPPAGRVISRAGTFSGTGPPVTPLHKPVIPAVRVLPPRGVKHTRAGVFSGTGPAVTAPQRPVRAVTGRLPSGRALTVRITAPPAAPAAGPPIYPLHAPVTPAARLLPPRGTVSSRTGIRSGQGPAVQPLQRPARPSVPFPVLRGRVLSFRAPARILPPATLPLHQPVRSAVPAPHQRGITLTVLQQVTTGPFSGPPLTPLHQPVRAALPAPSQRGTARTARGIYSGEGPAAAALRQPVRARRPFPPAGNTRTRTGTFSGTGPPVTPLHKPVIPAVRVLPPRGVKHTRAGVFSGTGPALVPLHAPVRARPANLLRGHAITTPAPVRVAAPTTGPALVPLRQPVRGRLPLPVPGRAATMAALEVTQQAPIPAPLYPLQRPVRAPIPAPARGGSGYGLRGTATGIGVPLPPWTQPAAVQITFLRTGHVQASPVTAHPFIPTTGPAFTPLRQPVRSRLPLPPAGVRYTRAGVYSGTGPVFRLPATPVTAAVRVSPLRGHAITTPAPVRVAAPTTGPALVPLRQPVRGRLPLPVPGRAAAMAAIPITAVTPVAAPIPPRAHPVRAVIPAPARGGSTRNLSRIFSGTGPAVRLPAGPPRITRPLPPAGRVLGIYRPVPPAPAPTTGPAFIPLHQPVRGRLPLPAPGRAAAMAALAVTTAPPTSGPPIPPRATPLRPALPRFPVLTGRALATPRPVIPAAPVTGPRIPPRAQPWRPVIPAAARGGYTLTRTGTFSGTGPPTAPLHQPAGDMGRLAPPPAGRTRSSYIPPARQIPLPAPLHTPVTAPRTPPPAGRVLGVVRVTALQPTAGPPIHPARQPIRARQPLPPPGRAAAIAAIPAPVPPTSGPPIPPRAQPWRPALPAPHQHGIATTFLMPIYPPPPPSNALFTATGARWRWDTTGTQWKWGAGGARNQ